MSATHTSKMLAEEAADTDAVRVEKIIHQERITGLLRRLHQAHTLLSVDIPQVSQRYNSTLLSVRPSSSSMLLDELTPRDGHAHLLQQRKLHVHGQLRGVDIDFTTQLLDADVKDDVAYYRVALPSRLNYAQRRAHYRASIGAGSLIRVTCTATSGETLVGELTDIAVGGLGVRVHLPEAVLACGDIIPRCVIRFAPHDEIASVIEVRSVSREVQSGLWRIGGRFVDMERTTEARIARFVTALDRAMRKKDMQAK